MALNNTNSTALGDEEAVYKMPATKVCLLVIMFIATFTGIFGNILVVNVVLWTKELRTVGNYFIMNLALADICVSGIVIPFRIIGVLEGETYYQERPELCTFVASFSLTVHYCSLLSIGCISINRYVYICHKDLYPKIFTFRKGILLLFVLWITGFLLEIPNFFGFGGHVYDKKTLACMWDRTAHYGYNLFFGALGVCTPLVIISVCYTKIYIFTYRGRKNISTRAISATTEANAKSVASLKLAKSLFVIFFCFCMCWVPYAVVVVSDKNDTFPKEAYSFTILFAHVNANLNCIIYSVFNRKFRRAYMRVLGIEKCRENKVGPGMVRRQPSDVPFFISPPYIENQ